VKKVLRTKQVHFHWSFS